MPIRPLPRSLDPLPGESLLGYVLRLAHRLDRSPNRIAALTGLTHAAPSRGNPKVPIGRMLHLDPETAATFADATRLTAEEVAGLCLGSLRDRYPPLDVDDTSTNRHSNRIMGLAGWVLTTSIRYCPECLAGDGSAIQQAHGGAWQKLWHLPPVFACVSHRRLLAHRCPDCRQPVAPQRSSYLIPTGAREHASLHPAQCRAQVGSGPGGGHWRTRPVCGGRLDRSAPDPDTTNRDDSALTRLLAFQQRLVRLLQPDGPTMTVSVGVPAAVGHYFLDLRLLAGLIRSVWPQSRDLADSWIAVSTIDDHINQQRQQLTNQQRAGRHYDQPPLAAYACGSLLALAGHLLAHDNPAALRERLSPLIARHPARHPWVGHFLSAEAHCSDGLRAAIAAQVRAVRFPPRVRRTTRRPPSPRGYRFGRQHIPQLLPVDWYDRHFGDLGGVDSRSLRRAVPLKLIQLAAGGSLLAAAQHLGLSRAKAAHTMFLVNRWARDATNASRLTTAVEALADELDAATDLVNYERRRDTLTTWSIPWADWDELIAELRRRALGRTRWGDHKRLTASVLVWARITQSEPLLAPLVVASQHPSGTNDLALRVAYASHRSRNVRYGPHWPDLKKRLDAYADQLAARIDAGWTGSAIFG